MCESEEEEMSESGKGMWYFSKELVNNNISQAASEQKLVKLQMQWHDICVHVNEKCLKVTVSCHFISEIF